MGTYINLNDIDVFEFLKDAKYLLNSDLLVSHVTCLILYLIIEG